MIKKFMKQNPNSAIFLFVFIGFISGAYVNSCITREKKSDITQPLDIPKYLAIKIAKADSIVKADSITKSLSLPTKLPDGVYDKVNKGVIVKFDKWYPESSKYVVRYRIKNKNQIFIIVDKYEHIGITNIDTTYTISRYDGEGLYLSLKLRKAFNKTIYQKLNKLKKSLKSSSIHIEKTQSADFKTFVINSTNWTFTISQGQKDSSGYLKKLIYSESGQKVLEVLENQSFIDGSIGIFRQVEKEFQKRNKKSTP